MKGTSKPLLAPIVALADVRPSRRSKIIRLHPRGGDEPRILRFPARHPRPSGRPPEGGPDVA